MLACYQQAGRAESTLALAESGYVDLPGPHEDDATDAIKDSSKHKKGWVSLWFCSTRIIHCDFEFLKIIYFCISSGS
jgi:hypothetical protein